MIKMPLSVVRVAAFCLPLVLVASCGDDGAPNGSSITSFPTGYTVSVPFTTAGGTVAGGYLGFTVVVKNKSGAPVIYTPVYIYAPQATGIQTTALVTDGAGVTTGPFVITSLGYAVNTDEFGAINVQISIPYFLNLSYGDTISFVSGNVRIDDKIDVKCITSTDGPCPT